MGFIVNWWNQAEFTHKVALYGQSVLTFIYYHLSQALIFQVINALPVTLLCMAATIHKASNLNLASGSYLLTNEFHSHRSAWISRADHGRPKYASLALIHSLNARFWFVALGHVKVITPSTRLLSRVRAQLGDHSKSRHIQNQLAKFSNQSLSSLVYGGARVVPRITPMNGECISMRLFNLF